MCKKVLLRGNNTTTTEIISVAVEKNPVVLHFRLHNLFFLLGLLVDCHPVTVNNSNGVFGWRKSLHTYSLLFLFWLDVGTQQRRIRAGSAPAKPHTLTRWRRDDKTTRSWIFECHFLCQLSFREIVSACECHLQEKWREKARKVARRER